MVMDDMIRVATFNASLNRGTQGALQADLSNPTGASATITQARNVAEIIQRNAPDILLINEFDYDPAAAVLFRDNFLGVSQNGQPAQDYPYFYIAPSNTGVSSGFDLNNNGAAVTTPGAPGYGDDALGFGNFEGQFGMVIYSKYPIEEADVRTFQNFLWKDMPDARLPADPLDADANGDTANWYTAAELEVLPLSSKSHWDVPINVNGEIVHILAAHPTPPVFDGVEDRNGLRNADEIRFWSDYVTPGQGDYIYDDKGGTGGIGDNARFVIVGDYNADINDGDSVDQAIGQLLFNPLIDDSVKPDSDGGPEQSALQGRANAAHDSDPAHDTADFADGSPGNLRVDYVLGSAYGLDPVDGSVYWPLSSDPQFALVGTFNSAFPGGFPSSDHRMVTMDFQIVDETPRDFSDAGVASGDVTSTSAVLWARAITAGAVVFEISTTASFDVIVKTVTAPTLGVVPVHANVTGLTAGTDYYYRAVGANGDVVTGEFATAADTGYAGLRFGVSGDWRGGNTPYAALSNAVDADLDFFVQLGDTIYADIPSPAFPGQQAETLDEFRVRYEESLTERGGANFLADLRSQVAQFATIDDHEVTNDFAGAAPAASDPRFGSSEGLINQTPLFTNGLQAFQDYQPIEARVWSGTGDATVDGRPDLYRVQDYGLDATVIVTDARSFRDEGLTTWNGTPADAGRFLVESFTPGRTMLGDPQFERIKSDLLAAQADGQLWKFIHVPEPIQNLGPANASDRFEGYAAERTALLKFIDDNDIDNVVFVAADIHGTLVNNLTYQNAPGGPQIAIDAFEISTGSVAFSPSFGPAVVGLASALGLVTPQQAAFYNSLPVLGDADSIPNDRDDFIKSLVNQQIDAFGYDRVGLNDNLAQANGLVDAVLLQGDYVATHSLGWTQFDIDAVTHTLTVTTYGIPLYDEAQAAADPAAIAALTPVIVSQFEVYADQTLTGTTGNDVLTGHGGDDSITGGRGNDRMTGGAGDDLFIFDNSGRTGRDTITDLGIDDMLLFTVTLRDSDGNGIIEFGANSRLDTNSRGDTVRITDDAGAVVRAVAFDGIVEQDGQQYFAYSLVGSDDLMI